MTITEFLLARISEDEAVARDWRHLVGGRDVPECAVGDGFPCDTLQALAAVYADHPDYRQEWAL